MESVACCHSIAYVNGELIGDSLDVKMFKSTKWYFEEPENHRDGAVAVVSPS